MSEQSLYTRMLEGNEKSGECARIAAKGSRFQQFKELFFGNLGKVAKINLLTLLFFTPMLVILFLNSIYAQNNSYLYPFGANLGLGYPAMPDLQGTSEWLAFQSGLVTCTGVVLASILAAIGLAGGMYACRNMIWTEGVFVAKDFWRGVKLNYKNALQAALFFTTVLLLTLTAINVAEFNIAMGAKEVVWLRISQVVCYILLAASAMTTLWMIALGVNYRSSFFALFKNAFLMMIGTFPQTVFFGAIAIVPYAIFLLGNVNSIFTSIGLSALILISFSFSLLEWLSFAQWVFDRFVNPKTQAAKPDSTVYNKDGTPQLTGDDSASVLEYQRAIVAEGRSKLLTTPVKPVTDDLEVYELPKYFTREDLERVEESRKALFADAAAYAEAHKNDAVYTEYNERFEARERALKEQEEKSQKGKKKKK